MTARLDRSLHCFRSAEFRTVVAEAISFFNHTPVHSLPPPEAFEGEGVYALYYVGRLKLYVPIALANRSEAVVPIYVGKAVPEGWRTARSGSRDARNPTLHRRLSEHAKSIRQGKGLSQRGFTCRFMILEGDESDLISTVEAELIRRYNPLWNSTIDGFGNHDPGSGRYAQAPSEWDVLHPGRAWAAKLTGKRPNLRSIVVKIREALEKLPSS